jgi:hypothetical protein
MPASDVNEEYSSDHHYRRFLLDRTGWALIEVVAGARDPNPSEYSTDSSGGS